MAYSANYEPAELYYWEREKSSAQAEVDYLTQIDSTIFPIEVKSGKTGRLRSLQLFLQEKKGHMGIRISAHPLSFVAPILSVPLYMIGELPRLVREVSNS